MGPLLVQSHLYYFGGFSVGKAAVISILVSLLVLLFGCSWGQTTAPWGSGLWAPSTPPTPPPYDALGVLNWTSGLLILGGVAAMVLTRGRIWRPIAIGTGLVILSYVMAVYSHWVLLPLIICLSILTVIWGYKLIIKAWRK